MTPAGGLENHPYYIGFASSTSSFARTTCDGDPNCGFILELFSNVVDYYPGTTTWVMFSTSLTAVMPMDIIRMRVDSWYVKSPLPA